ncbi:MAG: flagellin N-terminal helical domain-containing protein, partial [Planctomycetota bacterium]
MEIGDISNPNNGLQSINAAYSSLSSSSESIASGDNANLDAAAMAIIEMSNSRIAVSQQGTRNANDAISMLQTFEAAGSEISNNLGRMSRLASQAATGTYSSEQKALMQQEFDELGAEVNRIASNTLFNGNNLISSQNNSLSISIGTDQSIEIESADLGIDINGMDLVSDAQGALTSMQDMIDSASSYRAYLGSKIN